MTDAPPVREHEGLVVGSAGMMVAGFLTTFLSPLLAVSFASEFNFGFQEAGLIVACGQGGVALAAFGSLPFLPRLNRRLVGTAGALIAAACLVGTGFANTFGVVLVLQIIMGVGAGLAYASANSALAYARLPERAFSIVTISWMLVGAGMLSLGPFLHDAWPKVGLYLGMAAAELLCIVLILRLPDVRLLPKDELSADQLEVQHEMRGVHEHDETRPSGLTSAFSPSTLLIAAVLVMNIGNLVIWTFAQEIGEQTGLSSEVTSSFLGLSQLIGLAGAGITLAFGNKVGKMMLLVPAVSILAIGNLLVGTASSPAPFLIGFLAVNISFFCISPLLLALAAELDTNSGRLVVVVGAVTLVAGAIAPALGGFIAGAEEAWARLGITALVLVLISLPLLVRPVRTARKRSELEAELAAST